MHCVSCRETQPAYFGVHHGMVYYQRRCGTDVSDVPITVINAQRGGVIWMKGLVFDNI